MLAYRAGYLAERPPADRARPGRRDRPRRGRDQRSGARSGHRRPRHRGAVRLPGQSSRLLAAGGPGRTARRRGRGAADRPAAPAGRVPAGSSRRSLFDQPVETTVLDPASPAVLGPQLAAAAQELPLRPGDERWFGASTWVLVSRLTERGLLRRRPDGWYWTAPRRAVDRINLRSRGCSHTSTSSRSPLAGCSARSGSVGRRPGGASRCGLPAPGRELSCVTTTAGRRGRRGHTSGPRDPAT